MADSTYEEIELPLYLEEDKESAELKTDAEILMWQRETSGFIISVRWLWVVHGKYSRDDPTPASLLVFRIKLSNNTSSSSRRYKHFSLELRFENVDNKEPDEQPEVTEFAPAYRGSISLEESTENQKILRTKEVGLEGGASLGKGTAALKEEKETEKEKKFSMHIEADKKRSDRRRLGEDIVWWNFKENESQGRGVVDSFGVAILIKRSEESPDDKFVVHSTMKATIDFRNTMSDVVRRMKGDREQPFPFDPKTVCRKMPAGLDVNALADFVDSGKFEELAFVHVPEPREAQKFYP